LQSPDLYGCFFGKKGDNKKKKGDNAASRLTVKVRTFNRGSAVIPHDDIEVEEAEPAQMCWSAA
jgi:hypothetical protein